MHEICLLWKLGQMLKVASWPRRQINLHPKLRIKDCECRKRVFEGCTPAPALHRKNSSQHKERPSQYEKVPLRSKSKEQVQANDCHEARPELSSLPAE